MNCVDWLKTGNLATIGTFFISDAKVVDCGISNATKRSVENYELSCFLFPAARPPTHPSVFLFSFLYLLTNKVAYSVIK
jgi:hypothetical protein